MDYPGKVITKNAVIPTQTSAPGVWTLDDAAQAQKANSWPIPGVLNPISKSLRFNSADSAYLNRTPSVSGNRQVWTWSGWVKRSQLSAVNRIFAADDGTPSTDQDYNSLLFNSSDQLVFGGNLTTFRITSAVYRDVSAWYHIVLAVDTTQATANNRIRIYVNGSEVTVFASSTNPTQNVNLAVNDTIPHYIGSIASASYFNGYMTEVNFIDGQALTPSDFGMTDTVTGVWVPKKYTGTYGTNGFYLNFKDSTNTTTLGYDYSGNGNNWNANNFSVTAGAGNDSLTDVPTPWVGYNTNGDTGGIVRGNYPTLNPLNQSANMELTDGNLRAKGTATFFPIAHATMGVPSSGKWYWEYTVYPNGTANAGTGYMLGIAPITAVPTKDTYLGNTNNGYALWAPDGSGSNSAAKRFNSSNTTLGSTFAMQNGDVIQIAFDIGSGKIWFGRNNTWFEGNPATDTTPSFSSISTTTTWVPAVQPFYDSSYTNNYVYINFGQRPFAYTPPSGYKSLCTTNLPTPTIVQGDDYFNAVLWTGNGSTSRGITGVGFQPDFTWIKTRSGSSLNHTLFNAIVGGGANKGLASNTTASEASLNDDATYGYLNTFDSDGFTVEKGSSGGESYTNAISYTYVAWNWKANGTGVTNTAGTITSTVSANTTSGFSIVTWSGTGSGTATVGHGLGATPSMVILKFRNALSAWSVYHASLGNTKRVTLNTTDAEATSSGYWNNTSPTSSVFTLGTDFNQSFNYVAYCFAPVAGYSAFGSYIGNGSADGPFVYTGFRPAYVLFKQSSASGIDWMVFDSKRNTYNAVNARLFPSLSNAEVDGAPCDFLSNGFKMRENNSYNNQSGATYIYAAFAENPFKFANAR